MRYLKKLLPDDFLTRENERLEKDFAGEMEAEYNGLAKT